MYHINQASDPNRPSGQTTTYSANLGGDPVRAAFANQSTSFAGYDLAHQFIAAEQDPNNPNLPSHTSQETFGYDLAGNGLAGTDWDGRTLAVTLDGDSRTTQTVATSPVNTTTDTLTYDPDGNVVGQSETSGGNTATASARPR